MQSRKLSLMSFAVAAIAFAFTMDAHAATLAVNSAFNHADLIGGHLGAGALAIGSVTAAGAGQSVKHAATRFFRIAVEGATSDGRTIDRASLTQMAKNYNPEMYGARLNLEHYRGIIPDSPFKAYGDVIALETRDETGPLAGKLGLYAQIAPTPDLVALTKAKQKIYTSCEIDPSFADTNQAYLVGLAVTDSPASLGTQILSFAAQNPTASPFAGRKLKPTNLFTAAEDPVTIEFDEVAAPAFGALFSRVAELLGKSKKKEASDDTRFADVGQAVEALATHGKQQADAVIALTRSSGDRHRYHVAQRESYSGVRAHYHSNAKGKRKSVVIGGENNKNMKVLPEDYATEAEARAAAQAEFDRTQRSQATFDFTLARARPDAFPEMPVTVSGFKPEIDATPWLVKKATHTINDSGFETVLEMEMRDNPTTDRHRSHFRKGGR